MVTDKTRLPLLKPDQSHFQKKKKKMATSQEIFYQYLFSRQDALASLMYFLAAKSQQSCWTS